VTGENDKFGVDFGDLGIQQPRPEPETTFAPVRPTPSARAGGGAKAVRVVFVLLGLAGGVLAAIYAYKATSSWFLVVFTFCMVQWLVGRGFGQILTERLKVQRFFYYVVPTVTATGCLYLAQYLWDTWWLSVVLGLCVGFFIGVIAMTLLFPRVASQEAEDSTSRAKAQFGL
jgi:hypothetical protein